MNIEEINKMFSDMGLGSSEQRDKMVKELSINMVDSSFDLDLEITTSSNTLNSDQYA